MQSNNVVCLIGRLVADPELRSTGNGVEVASFRIAVDRGYAKKGEEKQTDFINCVAWRQTGVFVSKYFHKGSNISLVGSLQIRPYEDKTGAKRTAAEVVCESVSFCGSKNDSTRDPAETSTVEPTSAPDPVDDDYPFD